MPKNRALIGSEYLTAKCLTMSSIRHFCNATSALTGAVRVDLPCDPRRKAALGQPDPPRCLRAAEGRFCACTVPKTPLLIRAAVLAGSGGAA